MIDEPLDVRLYVLRVLREHEPQDEKEAADVAAISAFVGMQSDVFGKTNSLGHITGSAFIVDPDGRILLTHHAKLNRWLQLGGHSRDDEHDPADTAFREAQEESGLQDLEFHPAAGTRPIDIDIHEIPAKGDEGSHEHLDFRYLFVTRSPDAIVRNHESKALRWVAFDELAAFDFDPALRRAIQKVRRLVNLP